MQPGKREASTALLDDSCCMPAFPLKTSGQVAKGPGPSLLPGVLHSQKNVQQKNQSMCKLDLLCQAPAKIDSKDPRLPRPPKSQGRSIPNQRNNLPPPVMEPNPSSYTPLLARTSYRLSQLRVLGTRPLVLVCCACRAYS